MNLGRISTGGVLFTIAATVLLMAPNGYTADPPTKGGGIELKPKVVAEEKLNVKDLDEEVSHLEVVDSKGNAYLLIPLKTAGGNKPVVAEDGKIIVEYVHQYRTPTSR